MDHIPKSQYEKSKQLISFFKEEIIKNEKIIHQYIEQEAELEYKADALKAKEIIIKFRKEFSKVVESAITNKYGSLDEYVNGDRKKAEVLKRQLMFKFSGLELTQFIYEIGLRIEIRTVTNKTAFFPFLGIKDLSDSQRTFKGDYEKHLIEVINSKHSGLETFKTKYRFSKQEFSSALWFQFNSERDFFKILYFTGSTMEFTFKYEKAIFVGKT